jgi:Predicted acyltransferase
MSRSGNHPRSHWTGRSLGKRWQHAFFYGLIRLGGRRAAYAFLVFVICAYMFKSDAAKLCRPYLSRRFPDAGPGIGKGSAFGHRWLLQWELGKALVDRAAAGIAADARFGMDAAEEDALRALHAEGRGLILLASHVGCWHISIAELPNILPGPANVVMFRAEGDYDRQYYEHNGDTPPVAFIDAAMGPRSAIAMAACLQRGETLCLMGDRPLGDARVCGARFLGGDIHVPYTAFHLASVSGAPIAVFFALRTGPGAVRHTLAKVIRVPGCLGKSPEAYEPYAGMYAEALERLVAAYPYQFFNLYDMWDTDGHQDQTETSAD